MTTSHALWINILWLCCGDFLSRCCHIFFVAIKANGNMSYNRCITCLDSQCHFCKCLFSLFLLQFAHFQMMSLLYVSNDTVQILQFPFVTRWEQENQSRGNCTHSSFVCQFYNMSNPHATSSLTTGWCVCMFEGIWFFPFLSFFSFSSFTTKSLGSGLVAALLF